MKQSSSSRKSSRDLWSVGGAVLILAGFGMTAIAQTVPATPKAAEPKSAEAKGGEPGVVETYHVTSLPSPNEFNDIQTALRNTFSHLSVHPLPDQNTIVMRGSPEELEGAKKLLASFDQYKKTYRLTYTINESDNGKRIGSQHFVMVVVSGAKTDLRQGSKVPIMTGGTNEKEEVTYLDIGLEIEASVDGYKDGMRAHTKVSQSSIAEEKAGVSMGTGNPVIRQTTLEGTALLEEGKPLVLGSLDVPGSTRHEEIEVVSELIH